VDPRPPGDILILTAVELEASALARHLELPAHAALPGRAFGRGSLRVAPVGLRAALLTERWPLLAHGLTRPLVVSAGLCGGLDPALAPGDLVCPELVLGAGGARYRLEASPHRARVVADAGPVHAGPLVTTRDLAATPADKAALRARTGAAAVDMESAAIVQAAEAAGWPWLVLRGVSDGAGETLHPELAGLVGVEGRLRLAGAVALALTRPRAIPRAIGLGRRARRALAAVARALAVLGA